MNYCSIKEAWGNTEHITEQFSSYMNENFTELTPKKEEPKVEQKKIDYDADCDEYLMHFKKCKKCFNKLKAIIKPSLATKLTEQFEEIVEENKDTIVLILIGISLLMFFNLINNLSKN
jgi:hypothetical protein